MICLLCLWVERLDDISGVVGLCLQIQELIRGGGNVMSLAQVCLYSSIVVSIVLIVGVRNDGGFSSIHHSTIN